MAYRVLDPGWTKLYGRNLAWLDAKKLKNMVANRRISTLVMIEAEDVPVPEKFQAAADAAIRELLAATTPSAPVTPAPLIATPGIKVIGGIGSPPVITSSPAAPPPSLEALQSNAMAAAARAAGEADQRAAAAQRRAEYKRQSEEARKKLEADAAKADELGGGDDVGDGELADFLDGTGMPTDAEIAKAKAKADAEAKANPPK